MVWGGVAALIPLPLVGVERRAASGDVVSDQAAAGFQFVGRSPTALLARVTQDHTDEGRAMVAHMSRVLWAC